MNYTIPRTSDAGYACREQKRLDVGGLKRLKKRVGNNVSSTGGLFPRGVEAEVAEVAEVPFCAYDS